MEAAKYIFFPIVSYIRVKDNHKKVGCVLCSMHRFFTLDFETWLFQSKVEANKHELAGASLSD